MDSPTTAVRTSRRSIAELPAPPAEQTGWPWTETSSAIEERGPGGHAWPAITIVTPSYNQGEFLEETIRSVLLQGYPNLQYIVIDGGSTDNSVEIIRKYERWIDCWVSERDRGQSHAINKGFAQASGEILGWLNSDDLLLPNALTAMATAALREPQAIAWAGHCKLVTRTGGAFGYKRARVGGRSDFADWWHAAEIVQPGCFFRRHAFQQIGGVREDLHYTMDVELWIRLAELGQFAVVDQDIAVSRIYPAIKSLQDPAAQAVEMIATTHRLGESQVSKRQLLRFVETSVAAMPWQRIVRLKLHETYLRCRRAFGRLLIQLGLKNV